MCNGNGSPWQLIWHFTGQRLPQMYMAVIGSPLCKAPIPS